MSTNIECLTLVAVQAEQGGSDPRSPDADGRRETQTRPATSLHPPKKSTARRKQFLDSSRESLNTAAVSGGYAERIASLEAAVEQLSRAYAAQSECLKQVWERLYAGSERMDGVEAYLALRAQMEASKGLQQEAMGVTIQ